MPQVSQWYLSICMTFFSDLESCFSSNWLNIIIPLPTLHSAQVFRSSKQNTSCVSHMFYSSVALICSAVCCQMEPISQVCGIHQVQTHHITFPGAMICSCVRRSNCLFVCALVLFASLSFCLFACFMRTVNGNELWHHACWTLPCPLVLPDPVNWCISLLSKWLTSPDIVFSL